MDDRVGIQPEGGPPPARAARTVEVDGAGGPASATAAPTQNPAGPTGEEMIARFTQHTSRLAHTRKVQC